MKYHNWPAKKEIPLGMEVVGGWVMPEDVAIFCPDESILKDPMFKQNPVIYMMDSVFYDLLKHKEYDEEFE